MTTATTQPDLSNVPQDVVEKLAELDLELSEGDITQKGYEKKRSKLLAPYTGTPPINLMTTAVSSSTNGATATSSSGDASPGTRAHRRHHRRLTRDEGRFHSEIRTEAVQQALAEYSDGRKEAPKLVQPQRRTNAGVSQERKRNGKKNIISDSSSDDDDSLAGSTGRPTLTRRRTNGSNGSGEQSSLVNGVNKVSRANSGRTSSFIPFSASQPGKSSTSSAPSEPSTASEATKENGGGDAAVEAMLRRVKENHDKYELQRRDYGEYVQARIRNPATTTSGAAAGVPAVKRVSRQDYRNSRIIVTEDEGIRISPHREEVLTTVEDDDDDAVYVNTDNGQKDDDNQEYQNAVIPLKPARVSSKIQSVVNALQRPKSKPLQEFYNDDDAELEAMARIRDPAAPRPEGATMIPVRGDSSGHSMQTPMPKTIESQFSKYANSGSKFVAGMVLDQSSKIGSQLTYGKLLSRAHKVAHMLLNKTVTIGKDNSKVPLCRAGDRVALVYPNTQPLHFMVAFHGCILAGVVPVPVELPTSKRDAGIAQLGFLLGNCGVKVALTTETCYKGLPKKSCHTTTTFASPSGSSSLHGSGTECVDFRGWPMLYWVITENMSKPPRDWTPPTRSIDETTAYVEYATAGDGSVKGVCVSRIAMISHSRAVTAAMDYADGDTMVCVVDFKREVGLWHAMIAAVLNGVRVIFVPYSLMKLNPASWMNMVSKYQAKTALVKSRDLHWALLATRDHKDVSLASLRSLLIADGANPWSLSSCDAFVAAFANTTFGLRVDAMCPCAGSSETGTISIRRVNPGTSSAGSNSGRGVLSMASLSHGVVRVDQENSLTSLTLQDAGQIIGGAVAVVLAADGSPRLCQADEVGEICISSNATATSYWSLEGQTSHTFKVEPIGENGRPLGVARFVRSGLFGFMGPDGLVFVVARRTSLLHVSGRFHSADDIIATVLAVEPMRFVYRGRICVFSVNVLRDERIVIVAEQKPGTSEEDAFNWMSRVLQAIDTIHQVGIYCLALVHANHLPKTPLGGIHVSETKQKFTSGELHPCTLLMCPHSCVLNLPKPREKQSDVGPAAMFVGNIVQGVRMAVAQGRSLEEEASYPLLELLKSRAASTPDHKILTLVTAKSGEADQATCSSLLKRAERMAGLLTERGRLNRGDHVALIFPPSIDLVAAFFGCLVAGFVPVLIRPPSAADLFTTLPSVRMMVDMSKSVVVLAPAVISKMLKSKEAAHRVDSNAWPMILDMEDAPSSWRRKAANGYSNGTMDSTGSGPASRNDVCYLDFTQNTNGQLQGVVMSEAAAVGVCKSLKMSCELYPSRHVAVCAAPYSGPSLILWCLSSVYSGHHTTLIPPNEVEQQPNLFLATLSALKVRDAFTTYATLQACVNHLASAVDALKEKGINLSALRSCVALAEERPRTALTTAFCKLFAPLGLSPRCVSTSFSSRVNPAICMQGATGPDPTTVYVDGRALRHDRIALVGKGAPHSVALTESGKLMPGVRIAIANPETRGQCADSHLGEIWVASSHNGSSVSSMFGEDTLSMDAFSARLTTGDTRTRWARTGYIGFIRQTQAITEHGDLHDAVFVVGSLDESLSLRGMRYHPTDIEATVSKSHRLVLDAAVFTWNHLVVVVAECSGSESEALDLVPAVTSSVLEEHHLIVGVVVIVDPGDVRHGPSGEKQRGLIRDLFLKDKLDPVYVAYNM